MLKIAVLGGRDTVMGFKALGLDVFPAGSAEEAKEAFRRLTRESEGEYAIIYVEGEPGPGPRTRDRQV